MANILQSSRPLLRKVFVTNSLDSCATQNAVCMQFSRGARYRKPPLLAMAKSKWFKIPKRPNLNEEETAEVRHLNRLYATQVNSICQFFRERNAQIAEGSRVAEEELRAEEAEWERCLAKNAMWNKEVSVLREERLAAERKKRQEEVMEALLEQERKQQILREQVEELVRKEKELSKSYITAENIDEAIRYALENEVDYNFCIDLKGQIYQGRSTQKGKSESNSSDDSNEEALLEDFPLPPPSFDAVPPSSTGIPSH